MTSIFYKNKFKQNITVSVKIELKKGKKSLRKSEAKGSEIIDSDYNKFRENLKLFFQKHCRMQFFPSNTGLIGKKTANTFWKMGG